MNRKRLLSLCPLILLYGCSTLDDLGQSDVDPNKLLNDSLGQNQVSVGNAQNSQYSQYGSCLLYTSPSPRDRTRSRMPSSA